MPKVILEFSDIENILKEKYPGCEIISGLKESLKIIIKVDSIKSATLTPVSVKSETIDATKEGLALPPREKAIPGGAMGRERGNLRVF